MKITKHEHACLTVEDNSQKLIIDPADFANSLKDFNGVTAVVITHVHQDHFGADNVKKIIAANHDVKIFTTEETAKEINDPHVTVVKAGDKKTAGNFTFEFFGGNHAHVHDTFPTGQNVGVLVNDSLYYPGDSFDAPDKKVKILAIPVSGPWLKTGESMDFLLKVKPSIGFPAHDGFLSDMGTGFVNNWLDQAAKEGGDEYKHLKVGDSFEV